MEIRMNISEKIKLLESLTYFKKLSGESVNKLATFIEIKDYLDGEFIYKEGDTSDFISFIFEGKVELSKSQENLPDKHRFAKYGFLGLSLFDNSPRSVSTFAEGSVKTMHLSKDVLENINKNEKSLAIELYRLFTEFMSKYLKSMAVYAFDISK